MLDKLLAGGGLLAALAASTCCILPLSLAAAGVGSASLSELTLLAPYQTSIRLLAIGLLGAGFWLAYTPRKATPNLAICTTAPSHALTRSLLWLGALVMTAVLSSGLWGRLVA